MISGFSGVGDSAIARFMAQGNIGRGAAEISYVIDIDDRQEIIFVYLPFEPPLPEILS